MAFPTTQDGGPARGCHDRHGWMPRGHSTTSSSGEHGQMVAARETAKASSRASGCPSPTRRGCSGSPRRELRRRSRERSDHQSTESTTSRIIDKVSPSMPRAPGKVRVSLAGSGLTHVGGLPLLQRFVQRLGLRTLWGHPLKQPWQ